MSDRGEPMDGFELALARRMRSAGDTALRPFDPAAVVAAASDDRPRPGPRWIVDDRSRWLLALVAAIALAIAIVGALAIGGRRPLLAVLPASVDDIPVARTASPTPSVAPTASADTAALDHCDGPTSFARHAGAVAGVGWEPGAVGPTTSVRSGAIAGLPDIEVMRSGEHDADVVVIDPAGKSIYATAFGEVPDPYGPESLAWSPDGRSLAISTFVPGGVADACRELFVQQDGRLARVLASPRLDVGTITWSPDGSALAVIEWTDGPHLLVVSSDLRLDDLGPVCQGCSYVDQPAWSPDGTRLAVSWLDDAQEHAAFSIGTVASGDWQVVPGSQDDRVDRWLDDSTVDVQADGMAAGGSPHRVTIDVDTPGYPRTPVRGSSDGGLLSPDGSRSADSNCNGAGTSCRVIVVDRDSHAQRTVWTGAAGTIFLAWSPDGQVLAISEEARQPSKSGVWLVGVDGQDQRKVAPAALYPLAWQPVWP